jgi:cyclopropane fatty-acyl-phospholipid synthase-like methyltransferase
MAEMDEVVRAYDRIAEAWRDARVAGAATFRERAWVDRLVLPLREGARVLDVGCGCGVPITAYLAHRGFTLVGLDASARLLALAREAVPGTRFVLGDMRTADPGRAFDAVVAWDSVFHLPRDDHRHVFDRFHSWLRAGGRLLLSLGGSADAEVRSEMFGETFTYSAHAPAVAMRLLEGAGFQVAQWEVDDPSSRGHVAVLATRRAG